MNIDTKKTMSIIAIATGLFGLTLVAGSLIPEEANHVKGFAGFGLVLLLVSSTILFIESRKDSKKTVTSKGDFNSDVRVASPGATDAQYTCASNIVAASVKDLLSEPGLNIVYKWAVSQAKNDGVVCTDGAMDTYGSCKGTLPACKAGFATKSTCGTGCKFTSLKNAIRQLIDPQQGTSGGKCNPPKSGSNVPTCTSHGTVCDTHTNKCVPATTMSVGY